MLFHKHQLIFIAIPKTATTSVWWLMRNRTDFWEGHHHHPMVELYKSNDRELVDSYYSFTIVRNPYDRFISAYRHLKKYDNLQGCNTPLEKLKWLENKASNSSNGLLNQHDVDDVWVPQSQWCCIHKIPVVDRIMRYENLKQEWSDFAKFQNERNSLSNILEELPRHNVMEDVEGVVLTDEEKKMIYKLYRSDFDIFEYSK